MTPPPTTVAWADPQREAAFHAWLAPLARHHGLIPSSLRPASADASFRRYLRLDAEDGGSAIVMDAPPDKENSEPFVRIAGLMRAAGLRVPQVLDWQEALGFLLLDDLGTQTMLDVIDAARPQANEGLYRDAVAALLPWQQASRPGVLPPYDEAVLRRELQLFPDWYLARHKGLTLGDSQQQVLHKAFDLIVARVLAMPTVYVHRDFMPRNLMVPGPHAAPLRGLPPPEGADSPWDGPAANRARALGVLDFQDALHGPITYDIASLMRDAFLSWEEDFVIDVTVRYWEQARKLGLMDFEDWHADFGAFYRAVEWMGLQRHLKVAGIFARLTLRDGKPKYLADAPRFIAYIRGTAHRYRELTPLLRLVDEVEGLQAASGWAFGRT
jgi:aminoglycoside/choline kinase family phosphotransferase